MKEFAGIFAPRADRPFVMLWTAPTTGIAMCHTAGSVVEPLEWEPSYDRSYHDRA